MLTHDKTLRDNASAYASSAMTQPQTMPSAPYPTGAQPADEGYANGEDQDYYNGLAPYGNWNYETGYGWCWQPNAGLGYDYYPWGLLGYGFWFDFPGRGWCWFPNSRFNNFNRFNHFDHFNRFGAFAGNRFDGRFRAGANFGVRRSAGSFGANRTFGVNRTIGASADFRGFSPAMGHFNGGQFSGARSGGNHFGGGNFGGGHFSGGHSGFSGGHSGGMGGGHR
jgi:hypothetical protein